MASHMNNTPSPEHPITVKTQILTLAAEHGVSQERDATSYKAEAISRLADNDLKQDNARRQLIALRRAGVLTQAEGHEWLLRLHDEEDASVSEGLSVEF